jgi:hypothetical protein
MSIVATLLALGIAPTLGMMVGGGWAAAFAFVATAAIVTARAFSKHAKASADREAIGGELTPTQAIGMLSALRGQPLASSIHGKVEDLAKLAETDPVSAHARVCDLLSRRATCRRSCCAHGSRSSCRTVMPRRDGPRPCALRSIKA